MWIDVGVTEKMIMMRVHDKIKEMSQYRDAVLSVKELSL